MGSFEEDLKRRVWALKPDADDDPQEAELPDDAEPEEDEEEEEELEEAPYPFEEPAEGPEKPQKIWKKRRRRKKKHPFIVLLVFVLVIAAAVLILNSDLFAIRKIEVEGNRYYTPSQVIEMSGIESGRNLIFELKTRDARNRLLESPYIRYAHIERVLVGTVRIIVEERLEYAAVEKDSQYVIIDKEGNVLRIADEAPEITVMEGIELSEYEPGKPVKAKQTYLLTETLRLLAATDDLDLFFKKVFFSAAVVRTYLGENYYCEGTPDNILKNLPAIKELAEQHYAQNISKGVIKVGTDGYLSFNPRID